MNPDPASLDRLNDIVLPAEVGWWPLAPGWYVVVSLILVLGLVLAFRTWKRWRANAYRRAALRELVVAPDATGIAELLRRTALVIAPRTAVASLTGTEWTDWLAEQTSEAMPMSVREQLTGSVYGRSGEQKELQALRDYAARWISSHRRSQEPTRTLSSC